MTIIGMRIALDGAKTSAIKLMAIENTMASSISKIVFQEAHLLRRMIVMGIRRQAPAGKKFKPLADITKKRKKSSKALIDHGDLIRSITVKKEMGGQIFFVGVHKEAVAEKKGTGGQPGKKVVLANIAEVHEFGTKNKRIPARPYLRPSFEKWSQKVTNRILFRLVAEQGLDKQYTEGTTLLTDAPKKGFQGNISTKLTPTGKLSWKLS